MRIFSAEKSRAACLLRKLKKCVHERSGRARAHTCTRPCEFCAGHTHTHPRVHTCIRACALRAGHTHTCTAAAAKTRAFSLRLAHTVSAACGVRLSVCACAGECLFLVVHVTIELYYSQTINRHDNTH